MYYLGIAIFCTVIFIFQFIFSFISGDLDIDSDLDIDGDGISDFSLSDILSFKGLIHFGIGFGWTMWFNHDKINQLLASIIAVIVGIIFALVLYWAYKLSMKLESSVKMESGEDLVGRKVEIYLNHVNYSQAFVTKEGSKKLINVSSLSGKVYNPGEESVIIKYENGIYYIN